MSYPSFVQASLLSPSDIEKMSVVRIKKPSTKNTTATKATIFDPRLGPVGDERNICVYCGRGVKHCPGHFGHIRLKEPIFNYSLIPILRNILCCVCPRCGGCRVSPELYKQKMPAEYHRTARHKYLIKICRSAKVCPNVNCKSELNEFKIKDERIQIKVGLYFENISAAQAYEILLKISPETMNMMGFNEDLAPNPVFS